MKFRIDAGSDAAMIGVWDVSQNRDSLDKFRDDERMRALRTDAEQGRLFLVLTGGDGGGPVDVYLNEEIASAHRSKLSRVQGLHLLSLPSGRAVVGGAEDYRSSTPRITSAESVVSLPAGDYALEFYCAKDTEEVNSTPPSSAELEKRIGATEYAYYRAIERRGLYSYILLLVYPALTPWLGWKPALAIMLALLLGYSWIRERLLRNNARYQEVSKRVNAAWVEASRRGLPTFAITLRALHDRGNLKGGVIELPDLRE